MLPSRHSEENRTPSLLQCVLGSFEIRGWAPSPASLWFPSSPPGKLAGREAGFDQSLHKPELKPQLSALLKCLITRHDSSLTKTLKGLLFLLLHLSLPLNVRRGGRQGGGWIDFPHRAHSHNCNVCNFHDLQSSLQYNKCPHYGVCRPSCGFKHVAPFPSPRNMANELLFELPVRRAGLRPAWTQRFPSYLAGRVIWNLIIFPPSKNTLLLLF